jgi:phasin
MAQTPQFEIPQQLRDLAEKNVEHARTAYGQFMDAVTQAMGLWVSATPPNAVTSSFKVVQDRAVKFAKQNAEACFNLASELASAKDITDVLGIQSRHAQAQMHAYSLQAQELSRLIMEATTQSIKPKS